jgi:phasin family protein
MADETKDAVDTAAEAASKTTEAAGQAAKETVSNATAAAKQTSAAAQKQVRKNSRRVKAKRSTQRTQPKARTAAAKERNDDMNTTQNNWFASFGALPAAPFQSLFADAGERSQEALRRSQKAAEDLADLTRANIEALVESGKIAVEGSRSIGQDVVESGREGVEQAADAVRTLAEAKSPTEFVQLQSEFARASFDRFVAESSKLTESFVKLAGEAIQPISSRASENAERLNKFVA